MAEKGVFEYTYSAPAQDEVRRIRAKYLPKEVTKLAQLRALDAAVTKRGNAISIVHGILYSLILGLGMSCCLVWAGVWFVPGIVIGCIALLAALLGIKFKKAIVAIICGVLIAAGIMSAIFYAFPDIFKALFL